MENKDSIKLELEKYVTCNDDLFTQNEELSKENEGLRKNQNIFDSRNSSFGQDIMEDFVERLNTSQSGEKIKNEEMKDVSNIE